jgi:hypothetical protein
MKPQTPAEGILLHRDYGDAMQYTVTCECCGPDCSHNVWVEADDTGVTVTTYTKQKTRYWSLSRWQKAWRLLIHGYIEYEASIIMTEQQALNYARTLEKTAIKVAAFRDQRKAKQTKS